MEDAQVKLIDFNQIKSLNISPIQCYKWVDEMLRNKDLVDLPPKISLKPNTGEFCNVMPCIIPFDSEHLFKVGG